MADNTDLLNQIRQVVREEVKAETAPINEQLDTLHHGVVDVMQGQERLEKGQQEQGKKIDILLSGQSRIETAVKALATKQDVERVENKVDATKEEVDKIKKGLRPRHAD